MNNHHNNLNDFHQWADKFFLQLEKNFTHPKTRRDKLRYVKEYLSWLQAKQLTAQEVTYNDLLEFVGYLQDQGKAAYQRNHYIKAIEDYYTFSKLDFKVNALRIKTHRTTLKPLLENKDLEAIYENYEAKGELDQLLLSLVIWQGLEYEDIAQIRLQDVDLTKGELYIKSRRRRKARYLKLAPHQVMQLHNYIANTKGKHENQVKQVKQERLIIPLTTSVGSLYMSWRTLSSDVKQQAKEKLNLKVNNLQHLRQSRLAIWIAEQGLRQAQYKSGYTTVKGVERYRTQSTKALQEQLNKYHPLK